MRPELKRLILNARARLDGRALSPDETEENARQQALEDFKLVLAGKIDTTTRLELLFGGEYVWLENRPAVRFEIDGHTFLLASAETDCELIQECNAQSLSLIRLALSDPSFEDRLLAAVGDAVEPVTQ